MNQLVRHIEYLLVSNDCVVIPSLGAVIAHRSSARFADGQDGRLLPPSRTFSFNPSLTHNDGLLTASYARAHGVAFDSARSMVETHASQLRRSLEHTRSLSLGLAGTLTLGDEGRMTFTPGRGDALTPSLMWLPAVDAPSVGDLARRRAAAAVKEQPRVLRYAAGFARMAASVALLIALGFILSTPIGVGDAQYASFGVETFVAPSPAQTAQPQPAVDFLHADAPVRLVVNAHDDACTPVDTAAHNLYIRMKADDAVTAPAATEPTSLRFDSSDPYCLIVASLATSAEADRFIARHNDHHLAVLAKDGRYRVYAATGITSSQAQAAAAELAGCFPSAWVCRK